MATATLPGSRIRRVRPHAVLTGPLLFRIYLCDAGSNKRQLEPVAVYRSYDDAQAHFKRWLKENLKRPSGSYPLIVMDEEGHGDDL